MTQPEDIKQTQQPYVADTTQPQTGTIAPSDNPAIIRVQCGNNPPQPARLIAGIDRAALSGSENIGREVLVIFINGDPEKPVIIGMLQNMIDDLVDMEIEPEEPQHNQPTHTIVDGKHITLEAENQITLKCGKGSITIQKDGKIIVKGSNLLSRSSGLNRIKGGSVGIN